MKVDHYDPSLGFRSGIYHESRVATFLFCDPILVLGDCRVPSLSASNCLLTKPISHLLFNSSIAFQLLCFTRGASCIQLLIFSLNFNDGFWFVGAIIRCVSSSGSFSFSTLVTSSSSPTLSSSSTVLMSSSSSSSVKSSRDKTTSLVSYRIPIAKCKMQTS